MRFSNRTRKRFTTGSATTPGGSCDPTGSTSSARGRQGWETGQSSSTYSPGRMKRLCDTPGNSSGPTKSGKRSRKSPMLDTATLSEKSRIECSPRQATVPISRRLAGIVGFDTFETDYCYCEDCGCEYRHQTKMRSKQGQSIDRYSATANSWRKGQFLKKSQDRKSTRL